MSTGAGHKKKTYEKGVWAECLAGFYLNMRGYKIVARRYKTQHGEIDLIAWAGERLLVFVEVKTRSGDGFGGPEEAVDARKQDILARTAGIYMEQIDYDWEIRFDIIAVLLKGDKITAIRHAEDAFFPM